MLISYSNLVERAKSNDERKREKIVSDFGNVCVFREDAKRRFINDAWDRRDWDYVWANGGLDFNPWAWADFNEIVHSQICAEALIDQRTNEQETKLWRLLL